MDEAINPEVNPEAIEPPTEETPVEDGDAPVAE